MTAMLERAGDAVDAILRDDTGATFTSADIARAVLLAVRDPDDAFMLELYPDPKIETADRGRAAGRRSRDAGRRQIAHFVDAILNDTSQ